MSRHVNIDIRDGLSQSERFPRALHPGYFKPDERDSGQLLSFTIELAKLFNYYNLQNRIEGTWEEFFDLDMDVLLTLIGRIDIKTALKEYELMQQALLRAETDVELGAALNPLFVFLFDAVDILVKTRVKSSHSRNRAQALPVASVTEDCYQLSARFIHLYSQALYLVPGIAHFEIASLLPQPLQFPATATENLFTTGSTKKLVKVLAAALNSLFTDLRDKYSQLVVAAQYYLQHRSDEKEYDSHLGLYMAFLDLHGLLQQQMNHITQRHLDLYYQQILGIEHRLSVPDKVHLVLQPGPQISRLALPEGELLLADIAGTVKGAVYRIDQETVIGQAVIKELKTGFVSKQVQFSAGEKYEYKSIKEVRVFKGDYPVVTPDAFSASVSTAEPWPLMGEDQTQLPLSQRTMDDGVLGLLIGSPLLYVEDGIRLMQVKMYLEPDSYRFFKSYILNFSGVTDAEKSLVVHQLLSQAFEVSVTGEEGWMAIKKYSLRFDMDNASDPYLELKFKLYDTDKAVSVYQPELHGGRYECNWPLLKLEVNNSSFHNAFGFLRNMELSRISVIAQVTGSRMVEIQNNYGPVNAATPFQPFGPVPATGSYLDLKNTNIFNRFTRSFSLQMEWFDLPSEAGGFETYFAGYNNHVKNDSFTVSIAPLNNGKTPPAATPQQVVSLFNTWRDEDRHLFLSKDTVTPDMGGVAFAFSNNMLLNKETIAQGAFKEGAVRIELLQPADAFGHRLYPILFPAAVMHNAKRFAKKVPVPEQPYIPVMKSVEVSYTLEHSEVLNRGRNKEDAYLSLIHLYPFGYAALYPGKDTTDISFVPRLDQESNLLIGLQQVVPGQEVSFLFQIEEMKFHHTAHDTEKVKWSYLKNNKWQYLKHSDVLSDSTHNFIESGIIVLKLPDDIATGNTIVSEDCYWIKASINSSHSSGGRAVAVFTQAVSATRVQEEESTAQTLYSTWIPPGSIKGFKRKVPEILQTWQLFPSFGGRPEESKQQYYLRISERLRHKQRPRTSLDIAQVILDAFPEIMMVKCIGSGDARDLILPAINLQIIVIPREKEDGRYLSKEPGVSLDMLLRIKQFISRQLSVFATVEVGNPVYEKIKIVCSIQIQKDGVNTNDGYYIKMLNEDINRFVNPWLYGQGHDLKIGGKIYVQDILDDIKRKPYVRYVTSFSVLHFYKRQDMITGHFDAVVVDSAVDQVQYMEASRPDAVLIASDTHLVSIIDSPDYKKPGASGIGDFIVGDELTIYRRITHNEKQQRDWGKREEGLIDIQIDL
ncbi:hypothetical protein SAMN05421788_10661 [Filimonas lacunae]|uniref:Baseplate J-like protein n=1 Tax=Filimonas lacunae TaxID=477680 RepID=A0A173MEP3_9BACT|nr:hypothetical protein [Filimonas lacunae]BAV05987.1 hypothetical protein FLA_2002 [Filimonas lacunae]SIT24063.1 hypothetical protein SAMN05421788_10661 [Filimonas lacunae]